MIDNPCIFQFFHWYYPADGSLWKKVAAAAPIMTELGITHVWLPPAYKSADGEKGVGYGVYDLFDLGEFNQKGSVRTKYGTKEEFILCIRALQRHNVQVLADVVLNHKQGADELERIPVRKVNTKKRNEFIGEREEVELYTKYYFPNRAKKYSDFIWDWKTFTGIDQQKGSEYSIYKIMNEYGENWDEVIDEELGNFDYLMGADIELRNPYVQEELKRWAKWFVETSNVDGFRLDAVKHMSTSFMNSWIDYVRSTFKRDFLCIAEYWSGKAEILQKYIDATQGRMHLMDVPLHNCFNEIGKNESFDLRKVFVGSLLERNPDRSITFVDNHDTQPMQTLESPVADWFKPHAYAISLFRLQGMPCVFFPDLFGASYFEKEKGVAMKKVWKIRKMLRARRYLAYGEQKDFFADEKCIGWTRVGAAEKEFSGIAVLLNTADEKRKLEMDLGPLQAHKEFIDLTGQTEKIVLTDENGKGAFTVKSRRPAIWIRKEAVKWFE